VPAFGEEEHAQFTALIASDPNPAVSAANYLEVGIVIDRSRDPLLSRQVDAALDFLSIRVVPVTPSQARTAREAYRDFGRGSGHRAQLNFGDCFAYALATEADEPLLYKRDDFAHTGIRSAVRPPS
jgi:ribonuclease VapC